MVYKNKGEMFIVRAESATESMATSPFVPSVLTDMETGIEYIVVTSPNGVAITPRIKPPARMELSVDKLK